MKNKKELVYSIYLYGRVRPIEQIYNICNILYDRARSLHTSHGRSPYILNKSTINSNYSVKFIYIK